MGRLSAQESCSRQRKGQLHVCLVEHWEGIQVLHPEDMPLEEIKETSRRTSSDLQNRHGTISSERDTNSSKVRPQRSHLYSIIGIFSSPVVSRHGRPGHRTQTCHQDRVTHHGSRRSEGNIRVRKQKAKSATGDGIDQGACCFGPKLRHHQRNHRNDRSVPGDGHRTWFSGTRRGHELAVARSNHQIAGHAPDKSRRASRGFVGHVARRLDLPGSGAYRCPHTLFD